MLDVIKEYLVSLGFEVDNHEFNQAKQTVDKLGKVVQSNTSGMAKNYATAATVVVGAIASITAATAGLVAQVAKADMEYQKFALHMWMSRQQAKELKISLDAVGESVEDIAYIPELRQQYLQLLGMGRELQTPGAAADQLQYVRQITFEFKRLRMEATYALEWITYHVVKMLDPTRSVRDTLKDINDIISRNMPVWTAKVATWLASVVNVAVSAARFVRDIYEGFQMLPRAIKLIIGFLGALFVALRMSPVGWFIAALTFLLLMLEDFYGYMDGRKSSKTLAPFWKALLEFSQNMKAAGAGNWLTKLGDIIEKLWKINAFVAKLLAYLVWTVLTLITQGWGKAKEFALGAMTELKDDWGRVRGSPGSGPGEGGGQWSRIKATAERYLGQPYVWGGSSPDTGFDCSGYTQYVLGENGIQVPRLANDQYAALKDQGKVFTDASLLRPGDLVFMNTHTSQEFDADNPYGVTHVGFYAGNGLVLQSGSAGIGYRSLSGFSDIVGYGRVAAAACSPPAGLYGGTQETGSVLAPTARPAAAYYAPELNEPGPASGITTGDIHVHIGGTNATTDEISRAVTDGIIEAQGRVYARQARELSGVYGT